MADQGGGVSNSLVREYRKGNWTLQETMVLIEAKKMDDERRMKRSIGDHQSGSSEGRNKPTELRWKWVEDYCWRKGCFRSQNQCNDKWDNLMRDYKKVRDFERRLSERSGESNRIEGSSSSSYWKLEKNERKDKNLPSNMVLQIYEALVQVVERKGSSSSSSQAAATTPRAIIKGGDGCGGSGSAALVTSPISGGNVVAQPSLSPLQHHMSVSISPLPLLPPPTLSVVLVPPSSQPVPYSVQQPLPTTVDSDTSEHLDSPAKRRRRGKGEGTSSGGGTIGGAGLSTTSTEVGTAISRSASIIAEAIQACEEREERRHRELLNLHERRLRVEEINRQGVNGLVDAITKLADSIRALASRSSQQTPPDQ